jgi:hypothetical protein
LLNGHDASPRGCGSSEGGGRVEGGLGDLDAADAPVAEDLGVVAVGDELVGRVRQGLGNRRSLRGDEPDRVVLIWAGNFVFATWAASYFRLSVGPQ